jgi:hypothetical protein
MVLPSYYRNLPTAPTETVTPFISSPLSAHQPTIYASCRLPPEVHQRATFRLLYYLQQQVHQFGAWTTANSDRGRLDEKHYCSRIHRLNSLATEFCNRASAPYQAPSYDRFVDWLFASNCHPPGRFPWPLYFKSHPAITH